MALTIDDLLASPDHYLHSFDGDAAIFVPMDRAAYHRSIFLDGRILPAMEGEMRLPLAALPASPPGPQRMSWIFHVAHCGSTLLARALDCPEANLVLREPLSLRQAAVSGDDRLFALATSTISKRYRPDLPTIVKANVPVNFLLPKLAAQDPQAGAILLYLKLEDYLFAILRSDNHRDWLRRVTTQLRPSLGDTTGLADPERAALLWSAQLDAFARTLEAMPNARTLDAEAFFAAPAPLLASAARLLGAPMSDDEARAIVAGPLFSTYSKNPDVAFDNADRLARKAELRRSLETEIDRAKAWLEANGWDAGALVKKLRARAIAI